VTLAMTRIQLPSLVPGYPPTPAVQARLAQAPGGGGANVTWTGASSRPVRSLLGEFSITFFPRGGKPVQLEVGANGPAGKQLALSANVTRLVAKSGPRTVLSQHGRQPIRVNDVQVVGGKLVAGASLNKVNSTMDRVERIIGVGSIAVVLLIGLGVSRAAARAAPDRVDGQAGRPDHGGRPDRAGDPAEPAQRGRQARRRPQRDAGSHRDRRAPRRPSLRPVTPMR
jgi:hypothetical protein